MVRPLLKVEGVTELKKALTSAALIEQRTELRVGLRAAAEVVARDAQGRVPSRTGRARASIRATSTANRAFVVGGKARVPYYGWLDFGSRTPVTGNSRDVGPWAGSGGGPEKGRFILPAFDAKERAVKELVEQAVGKAMQNLGF